MFEEGRSRTVVLSSCMSHTSAVFLLKGCHRVALRVFVLFVVGAMANQHAGVDTETFRDVWQKRILPALAEDYESLKNATPLRLQTKVGKKESKDGGGDVVHKKLVSAIEDCCKHGERRNTILNLAWTPPAEARRCKNTSPLPKSPTWPWTCSATRPPRPHRPRHTDELEEMPDPVHTKSALEIAAGQAKETWKIPTHVEKGFEIPIALELISEPKPAQVVAFPHSCILYGPPSRISQKHTF